MHRLLLELTIFVTLVTTPLFGSSSITYAKNGTVDSINLDLSVTESSHRNDGALVLHASGSIEKQPVHLKLVVSSRWTEWGGATNNPKRIMSAEMEILSDGEESARFDALIWRSFPPEPETRTSFFCSTYLGRTFSPRSDLEHKRVIFSVTDCGLCGFHEIQLALDLPQKSLQMVIFEPSGGRKYPDRINEVFEKRANQSPEPTR